VSLPRTNTKGEWECELIVCDDGRQASDEHIDANDDSELPNQISADSFSDDPN
jgi:hypothetical protein